MAASKVSALWLPYPPFPTQYSPSAIEARVGKFNASIQTSLSHLRLKKGQSRWEGERERPCSDSRDVEFFEDHNHMSQRPTASHPQSNAPLDGRPIVPSSPQRSSQTPSAGTPAVGLSYGIGYGNTPSHNPPRSSVPAEHQGSALEAPSTEQRSSRSLGVHSILNPTEADTASEEQIQNRDAREKAFAPSHALTSPRNVPNPMARLPESEYTLGRGRALSGSVSESVGWNREPRRILTPKSPASRAAAIGTRGIQRATIDAKQSPFLTSGRGAYATEPSGLVNNEVPPIPTPPSASRYLYGLPPPAPTPPLQIRSVSGGTAQAPQSQSDSPATSYSSYSQLSQTSPAPRFHLPSTQSFQPPFSTARASSSEPQITLASDSPFGPAETSMGQSYQLMTFDTDQGPIQVPVDVQAASKMADEKRKRNAGASARFRQRRKEKEKEASQMIAKLEQQIRDLNEDRDFYRHERDYFQGLVFGSSLREQVVARPPSPQQRRALPSNRSSTSAGGWQGAESRGESTRATRRRTGAYAPPFALPPPTTLAPPLPQGYGPPTSFQATFPDTRSTTGQRPSEPSSSGLPPTSRPYDPFHPDKYDRSWNPGR